MQTILVTGGCGFIGAHTIVDLVENGFNVISIDNLSRASDNSLLGIEKITGKKIKNYTVNLTDKAATEAVFIANPDIVGIIHFAAYKAVGESVEKPLDYYENNRYFNPVGAHPSTAIGELPIGRPQNLVPAITQTAIGKLPKMQVHGADYDTRDGSCIRDYIHVCDIAHAHTLAIQYSMKNNQPNSCEVFNLGTGNGITVLEAIHAFEKVSGVKLNYEIGPRRAGDIVSIYANNDHAVKQLGWHCKYDLEDMMRTAWEWEQSLAN